MEGEARNRRDLHRARWRQDWESWNKLMTERHEHNWPMLPWMREVDRAWLSVITLLTEKEN